MSHSGVQLKGVRVPSGLGRLFLFCLFATALTSVFGCTKKTSEAPSGGTVSLASKGRAVYQSQCTACHNIDSKKPGSIGPEVWGSSKELLEARILRAEYPPGYTPKRPTRAMTALPHLANDIPALHAYLNQ